MSEQRRRPTTQKSAQKKRGAASLLLWIGILIILPGALYFGWQALVVSPLDEAEDFASVINVEAGDLSGDRAVVLVFPTWDATGYVTELRQIPSRNRQGEDLLSIIKSLCSGPEISGTVSALPEGTEALAAFYNEKNSTVILVDGAQVETLAGHLNLDHSFALRRWL